MSNSVSTKALLQSVKGPHTGNLVSGLSWITLNTNQTLTEI